MIDLYNADCLDVLRSLPNQSVDLVVTDPPYILETQGAGFFGEKSDEYALNTIGRKAYTYSGEWYVMKEIDSMKNGFSEDIMIEIVRVLKKINTYFFCRCENDTILDCFMGSGTTGVACKELNRNFIGVELNNNYFEIAKNRINENKNLTLFEN